MSSVNTDCFTSSSSPFSCLIALDGVSSSEQSETKFKKQYLTRYHKKYEILRDKSDNVQDGYTENYKTLLRETKEDTSKWRAYGAPTLEVSMLSCRSLQDQPRAR